MTPDQDSTQVKHLKRRARRYTRLKYALYGAIHIPALYVLGQLFPKWSSLIFDGHENLTFIAFMAVVMGVVWYVAAGVGQWLVRWADREPDALSAADLERDSDA